MLVLKRKKKSRKFSRGGGIIDTLINKLPIGLEIPSYEFCGPGTNVEDKIKRNVAPKNKLDLACFHHDVNYLHNKDLKTRHKADRELIERAWERFKASDASLGEKAAAFLVTTLLKGKVAMGAGLRKRKCAHKGKKRKGKGVKRITKRKHSGKKKEGSRRIKGMRVIPLPKRGGILKYLIPLLTGLSNIGSFAETANDLLKKVQSLRGGRGLQKRAVLAPFKRGFGLYLRPYEPKYKDPNY